MPDHRYILQPYKGKDTRYDCPGCGKHREFTRYIDTATGEHLATNVGICNRKVECGYHYAPKKYFADNMQFKPKEYEHTKATRIMQPKPVSCVPIVLFKASLKRYDVNNFVQFLCSLFGNEITTGLIEKYFIGTSKHWCAGASIFWQIDISGQVRTGKIMLYNPATGKRVKEPYDHFYWVHNELRKPDFTPVDYFEPSFYANNPLKEYHLKQCFFGEHILSLPENKSKPVCIFESEKTAIIASVYFREYLCLACGGLDGLSSEKCKVLQGRKVVLYPDLSTPDAKRNCFEVWSEKAIELSRLFPGTRFNVSDLLESKATNIERQQGLDLGDYLIRFDYRAVQQPQQPNAPQPEIKLPQPKETIKEQEIEPPLQTNHSAVIETENIPGPPVPDPWTAEIKELEHFFKTTPLPAGPLSFKPGETIIDITCFIQSHLAGAKNYNGKRVGLPYIDALRALKQYLTPHN